MFTLKQLRYFAAVARHRHFGRAAAECHVSQPALSLQIQEFERFLGTQLVERRRNAITLTEAGHDIAERANRILIEANDLIDHARHRPKLLSGRLELGVIPSIAPYLLPTTLPRLQESYPALDLGLRETQTATLLDDLVEGLLDVALLSLPIDRPGLETMHLFDDPFLLALPSGPTGDGTAMTPEAALAGENLLLLEEGHCLRDQALSFCGLASLGSRRQYGASSLSTIMQMVANGFGTTLLPAMALPIECRPDMPVKLYRFAPPAPSRSIGLAWRRTSARKADFHALGRILAEIGSSLAEGREGGPPIEPETLRLPAPQRRAS
ncbi:MAG TPA: LysR substrate-binding domain-containing protein [Bosea sp. (in: a-proteobacteria)]|jgi:LysR family hydrogen peroxide-inducible transcriptional activator|uniref:hydrogen peroxide-inducible genes activator n=1 Tax=Bosea sp. (in: a-proteobacteria) TaxID=1871050 RepID=UPI002E116F10|nr:LysR substrate-binding domain-containing protein [Bosea sp. (in: a-proteobacteria)]